MDRQDILKRLLYPKCKTALEFQFDSLMVNPLLSYITIQDIAQLHKIASSIKYSSKPELKYSMIDNILVPRGFKKMASGTNRVTYRCLNDYRVVLKVAIDKVGLSDNGNEYRNQHQLKPFVTKCFEISPCGTVGLFERVVPITSREEFINLSDDIFDLINNLIGKYVLEDIGEKFYMNYGLREGFGPVLLDYPYVFELDGRKLICNVPEPMSPKGYCGGEIDYDLGYNDLVCRRCGKRYLAIDLKSDSKSDKPKIIIEGEDIVMKCVLSRGDEVVSKLNSEAPVTTKTIKPRKEFSKLKAQIGVAKEEEKKEDTRPNIKTRDEVQLKVNLRGPKPKRDIDKEAREKEARIDAISEKIPVSFGSKSEDKSEKKSVSDFSAQLSGVVEKNVVEELPKDTNEDAPSSVKNKIVIADSGDIFEDGIIIGITNEEHQKNINAITVKYEDKISKLSEYSEDNYGNIFKDDESKAYGITLEKHQKVVNKAKEEIVNEYEDKISKMPVYTTDEEGNIYQDGKVIGVTIEFHTNFVKSLECDEATSEDTNEDNVVYTDQVSIATIGDAIAESNNFKGNENYKTAGIVAPIEDHYSAKEEKVEEISVEEVSEEVSEVEEMPEVEDVKEWEDEVTEEELDEIPELIINPRSEDTSYEEEEEFDDSEYEEESDEEENLIGEY